MNTPLEIRLFDALKRIAKYDTVDRLRKHSLNDWGVDFEEAIEMAYENIQAEAKRATHGVRIKRI